MRMNLAAKTSWILAAALTLQIFSPAYAAEPVTLSTPIGIRGLFLVDKTISLITPSDDGVTYQYKWYQDGILLSLETNSTLQLTTAHVGKTISAQVVASKSGFSAATFSPEYSAIVKNLSFTSNSSAIIDGVRTYEPYCSPVAPEGTAVPTIDWNVNFTCQVNNTSFGVPTSQSFQWYRGASPITGATSRAFNLEDADAGLRISAINKTVYSNGAVYLDIRSTTDPVFPEVTSVKPVITGNVSNGGVLTATTQGSDQNATLSYQWFRDFFPISGATNRTYTITSSDLGKRIQVLVTATRNGYISSSAISDPVSSSTITDPTSDIYNSIFDNYVPSNFNPDITYIVSPNVNQSLLSLRKAELKKAADFWRNVYTPVGNEAMYLTENDATWANNWMASNHPTWSSDAGWWIETFDCGYAFAVRFQDDYFFEQCLKTTLENKLEFQQITPHEYTHWVQYSRSNFLYTPATPWLIEGQANFYGLALGVAPEDSNHAVIDLTLAQHASGFDDYFQEPWSTQEVLQMLKSGNITDVQTLLSRSGTANHSYLIGTLMSEWLVYKFGHDTYWDWVDAILTGKNSSNDYGVAITQESTQTYFGMSFSNLARNAIPYLSMRAETLEERWIEEVTPDSPPGPPTITQVVAGNSQVSIAWNPGQENGAAITGYRIEWEGGSQNCPNSPCTITGLTNGNRYIFHVVALSAVGDSPRSEPSQEVSPKTVPTPPTNVQAFAGDGEVLITWTESEERGTAVTRYLVSWDGGEQYCLQSPCEVSGLTNGISYRFTVMAESDMGNSDPSSFSNSVIPEVGVSPAQKPGAPTKLKVVALKPGSSKITWLGAQDNGSPITKYEFSWKATTSKNYSFWIFVGKKTSRIVTGWKKGKSYHVRIRVTNSVGQTTSKIFTVKQAK